MSELAYFMCLRYSYNMRNTENIQTFPCSGGRLAGIIGREAQKAYASSKQNLQDAAIERLCLMIGLRQEAFQEITKIERNARIRFDHSSLLHQRLEFKFQHFANALTTPGKTGKARSDEKFHELLQALNVFLEIHSSELAADTKIVLQSTLVRLEGVHRETFLEDLYFDFDFLRKDRTAFATRMSRIKKIVDWVIEPNSFQGSKAADEMLQDTQAAIDWIYKVAKNYAFENTSADTNSGPLNTQWIDFATEVTQKIGTNNANLDNETFAPRFNPRSNLEETFDAFYSTLANVNPHKTSDNFSSSDFFSNLKKEKSNTQDAIEISLDLRVSGKKMEARFGLPKFSLNKLPKLQLKVLGEVHNVFGLQEFEVNGSRIGKPTIILTANPSIGLAKFSEVQLHIIKMLENEIKTDKEWF